MNLGVLASGVVNPKGGGKRRGGRRRGGRRRGRRKKEGGGEQGRKEEKGGGEARFPWSQKGAAGRIAFILWILF